MLYFENEENFNIKDSVVCLGKFDGLHKGHQVLINCIKHFAGKDNNSVIFTFANHPTVFFNNNNMKLIDSKEERKKKFVNSGVDVVIEYPFNKKVASMSAISFIEDILVKRLNVKYIVVGEDYHFGKNGEGNISILKENEKKYGYTTVVFPKLCICNNIISSSLIRRQIKSGNINTIEDMLGENYKILTTINNITCNNHDQTIINLKSVYKDKLYPPSGKYLVAIRINNKRYIANGIIRYIDNNTISISIILKKSDKPIKVSEKEFYVEILKLQKEELLNRKSYAV